MSAAPMLGHNRPDEKSPLRARLETDHAPLLAEIAALAAKADRAPKTIKNDDDLSMVSDLAKATSGMLKRADTARTTEKEPYLVSGRDIDAFFKSAAERLDRIKAAMGQRATDYLRQKEAEERRKAEAEAAKAREVARKALEEAARAEAANRPTTAGRAMDKAEIAQANAERLERAAAAPAADLARTRSASGASLATPQKRWTFEIEDLGAIDLNALRPYLARADIEKALRTFVQKGNRSIAGVRIFEEAGAAIR